MKAGTERAASRGFLTAEVQFAHLGEWFANCSIRRCSPHARAYLAKRGAVFFRKYALALGTPELEGNVLRGLTAPDPADGEAPEDEVCEALASEAWSSEVSEVAADDERVVANRMRETRERAWQLFESYSCVPSGANRPRYKDRLLALAEQHAKDPVTRVRVVISYVKLCFRTVVRNLACKEGRDIRLPTGHKTSGAQSSVVQEDDAGAREVSIFDSLVTAYMPSTSASRSLRADPANERLSPGCLDPSETITETSRVSISRQIAKDAWKRMSKPMRVSFAAKASGVSLANPEVTRFAGKGKTQLSAYLDAPKPGGKASPQSSLSRAIEDELNKRWKTLDQDYGRAGWHLEILRAMIDEAWKWLRHPENIAFMRFLQSAGKETL